MRLFVFNPELAYDAEDVADRVKEKPALVKKELSGLSKAGLIKSKTYIKPLKAKGNKKPKAVSKRVSGFILNTSYPHLSPLAHFLIDAAPITQKEIVEKIGAAGNIKLLLISGVFIHDGEARVDLLIVGDHLRQNKLLSAISMLESELGKELRYAAFETPDFHYRLGIYDKLIRDILEQPHQKLVNRLGL